MILLEELCNWSPGLSALVVREETPSPLPVVCLIDGLHQLTQQHYVVLAPCNGLALLLSCTGGPALPGSTLRLRVSHQAHLEKSLPEVHPPTNLRPYLPGSAYAQRICENDADEDKGNLGVPTHSENLPLLRSQYGRKPAPYYTIWRGVPDSSLCSQLDPTTLPNSVVQYYIIQVRPAVVIQEVSVDSL